MPFYQVITTVTVEVVTLVRADDALAAKEAAYKRPIMPHSTGLDAWVYNKALIEKPELSEQGTIEKLSDF